MEKIAIVMPVYNEEEAIGTVLDKWVHAMDALCINYTINAYDDGSKDGSYMEIQKKAAQYPGKIIAHTKQNSGHGPTILRGYREAANAGYDWVFQIDSDDEMGPEGFVELWNQRKEHDFLVGIREGRKQALPRKIISAVSRLSVRFFYGKSVWDVNSPYRLMRVSSFQDIWNKIPADTFAPNVIISGMAAKRNLRCFETGVPQKDRQTGEVSIKKWKLLKAAVKSFWQTIAFAVICFCRQKKNNKTPFSSDEKINFLSCKSLQQLSLGNCCIFCFALFFITVSFFSFIYAPFCADLYVFNGAAHQVDFQQASNCFIRICESWELKGIGNRFFVFLFHYLSSLFTSSTTILFQCLFNFFYLLFLNINVLLFTYCMCKKYLKIQNNWRYMYYLSIISFVCVNSHFSMQAEMNAVVILLLALSAYCSLPGKHGTLTAGLIFPFIFLFKSATLCWGMIFLAAVWLLDEKIQWHKIWQILFASLISFLSILLFIFLVHKEEFNDMYLASMVQNTFFSGGRIFSFRIFYQNLCACCNKCIFIPLAIFFIPLVIKRIICEKKYTLLIPIIIMFFTVFLYVTISQKFFSYHYLPLLFIEIIEIFFILKNYDLKTFLHKNNNFVFFIFTGIFLVLYWNYNLSEKNIFYISFLAGIFFSFLLFRNMSYVPIFNTNLCCFLLSFPVMFFCIIYLSKISIFSQNFRKTIIEREKMFAENKHIWDEINKSSERQILFLDDGTQAFAINKKSFCKYFFPIIIQRTVYNKNLLKTNLYKTTLNHILSYKGKYIICFEDWFFADKHVEIRKKIIDEYTPDTRRLLRATGESLEIHYFKIYIRNKQ